jgi:putative nucleotidyltransferase with HDIG domain
MPTAFTHNSDREAALGIVQVLQAAGHEAYFVGGCVRDLLLGSEPADYDVATSALPEAVERLFPHTKPVGRKFGVMLVIEGRRQIEIATFRAESGYQDGRRPEQVSFGDPRADAARRDFTINGLFLDPVTNTVRDWVGGEADLRARLIRTIGSPDARFAEDHLRLLRAVRFAVRLDFTVEPETFAAIRRHAPRIQGISPERIREELMKIFRPPHAARGLDLLHATGLLAQVMPELEATVNCEQSPEHHPEGTVFNHLRLMLEHLPADAPEMLPWAVLLHDVAKPVTASRDPATGRIRFLEHDTVGVEMAEQILRRLRCANDQIEPVLVATRHHMQLKQAAQMRKSTLRRHLLRPTFPFELELQRLDALGSDGRMETYEFLARTADELARQPHLVPPLLTGDDLLALGLRGPALGALLAEVRERQLADELLTRDAALAWVRERLGGGVALPCPDDARGGA